MRFETALTGGSPVWSGTSSPGRQNKTGGQRAARGQRPRPPPCRRSGTPPSLPSAGPRANSLGTGISRTWYSTSSSLDRRLPEPPIAAPRVQLRQLFSGRRQLSHFRPRAASPPSLRGNRSWGHRPQARPLLKVPRRSPPGSASWIPGSRQFPASWRRGPRRGRTLQGGAQASRPRLLDGRDGPRRVPACRVRMR